MSRVPEFVRLGRQYLSLRSEESKISSRKKDINKKLMSILEENGYDSSGHKILEFDEPIEVDGKQITGLQRTRRVSTGIDENRVEEILENHPEIDRSKVFVKVEYEEFDQNALFVLNQEGIITDDELDSIFVENIVWALDVIK